MPFQFIKTAAKLVLLLQTGSHVIQQFSTKLVINEWET
jgi:hypothetical protein